MFVILSVSLLLLLTGWSVVLGVRLVRVIRARNERRLLDVARGLAGDVPCCAGLSVLYGGSAEPRQIERLLAEECECYEVVVVADALLQHEAFSEVVARYRMIRVNAVPSSELPLRGIRTLYRSRQRCYRRLVLVDCPSDSSETMFNAAAGIASYDYLLPLRDGQYLLPGTVFRLQMELARHPSGRMAGLRSGVGLPVCVLSRESVRAAGGFGRNPWRHIPRNRRRTLWEPLGRCAFPKRSRGTPRRLLRLLMLIALAASLVTGWWPVTALLLALFTVDAIAGCLAAITADAEEAANRTTAF